MGVALVGLLQMFIWGVMLFIIMTVLGVWLGVPEVTSGMVGNTAMAAVPETGDAAQILSVIKGMNLMEIGVMFVLCFIGGYLFYASFFAGVGSAVNSSEDTGQFMVFHDSAYFSHSNDGAHSFWCSLVAGVTFAALVVCFGIRDDMDFGAHIQSGNTDVW